MSQSATLFLRGKCIRRRMMSNTDRVLRLRSGQDPTAQRRTTDHDCAGILSHKSNLRRGLGVQPKSANSSRVGRLH